MQAESRSGAHIATRHALHHECDGWPQNSLTGSLNVEVTEKIAGSSAGSIKAIESHASSPASRFVDGEDRTVWRRQDATLVATSRILIDLNGLDPCKQRAVTALSLPLIPCTKSLLARNERCAQLFKSSGRDTEADRH